MSTNRVRALISVVFAAAFTCVLFAPAASASTVDLGPNWQVQSSSLVPDSGNFVSQAGYTDSDFLPVHTNDANAVGGEVAAQVQNIPPNDMCGTNNIYFSNNLDTCQGVGQGAHSPGNGIYSFPWWFRTDFTPNLQPGQDAKLEVRGIMGQGDLWVNGVEVATRDTLQGSEAGYTFDITNLIRPGTNGLAFKLYPNNPGSMLTQDFNDWTQVARDQNTGIKYPVRLHISNALQLSDAHVNQDNASDMSSSNLTVKGTVTNTSNAVQTGDVDATITDPNNANPINLHTSVTLNPGESKVVQFNPQTNAALHLVNPQLWWPYQMGGQPLYHLSMQTSQSAVTSDTFSETFGIRTISTWLTSPGSRAYAGSRWFAVNGKPFVFRGGGMMDQDMFLRYSHARLAHQIQLIKTMGLNGMRLEGDDQPDDFYQQMDEAGLLVYGGFLCCDKWELSTGTGTNWSQQDYNTNYSSALNLGQQERNHPSVFMWSWSDNNPSNHQEMGVLQGFADADFDIPVMASAEMKTSVILGPSGMKEGPYNYFPPSYAYSLNCTGSSGNGPCTSGDMTNRGGAWAFDSEQSPGSTVPTQDSLDRMMTPAEQLSMVTNPQLRLFHSGRGDGDNGSSYGSFPAIHVLAGAICNRYGSWTTPPVSRDVAPPTGCPNGNYTNGNTSTYASAPSIGDFVKKGIASNYESQRADFEAFISHSTRSDSPSTGLDYWMMNKPYPSLLWNFYNYDYDQAGSYFGTKKANENLHVFYSYPAPEADPDNRTITVDNMTGQTQSNLSVTARTYDMQGSVLTTQNASNIVLPSQGVQNQVLSIPNPTLPDVGGVPQKTYFLELLLNQGAQVVDRNVYWLSTANDVPTYGGNAYPNVNSGNFGDLRNLQTPTQDPATGLLPTTTVQATATTHAQGGLSDGQNQATDVTLTNNSSTMAFMLRVDVRRGTGSTPDAGDNQVHPASYSDNYVTLWPGQSQTITETYDSSLLNGEAPVVSVSGFNVGTFNIAGTGGAKKKANVEAFGAANGDVAPGSADPGKANTPEVMSDLAGKISTVKAHAKLRGNRAVVRLACGHDSGGAPCQGSLTVTARGDGKVRTLASAPYSVSGDRATVRLKASPKALSHISANSTLLVSVSPS